MPVSLTPPNNLSAVSLTPANSLSPVSTTPAINIHSRISPRIFEKNFRLFGYFPMTRTTTPAINFSPVSLTPLNSLSPVSTTPAINIHSQLSPRIFEKIQNGPNRILGGLGDTDSWKKTEVENLVSDSL